MTVKRISDVEKIVPPRSFSPCRYLSCYIIVITGTIFFLCMLQHKSTQIKLCFSMTRTTGKRFSRRSTFSIIIKFECFHTEHCTIYRQCQMVAVAYTIFDSECFFFSAFFSSTLILECAFRITLYRHGNIFDKANCDDDYVNL